MKTISKFHREVWLTEIEADGVSTAVAAGRIVLDAMRDESDAVAVSVRVAVNDLSESVWAEMEQYLSRRGVALRYDHEDAIAEVAQDDVCPSAEEESEMERYLGVDRSALEKCHRANDTRDANGDLGHPDGEECECDWHHYVSIRYSAASSGYSDCACCGEVIIDARLCEDCIKADCPETGDDCQIPQCPECETRASLTDGQWHSNCDAPCANSGKAWGSP